MLFFKLRQSFVNVHVSSPLIVPMYALLLVDLSLSYGLFHWSSAGYFSLVTLLVPPLWYPGAFSLTSSNSVMNKSPPLIR
jgi:hypothetical protein